MTLDEVFTTWPFSVVPDRDSDVVWAGRPELRQQVENLFSSFSYRPPSTLDLIWASFGSGKTHLLYYMEQLASKRGDLIPWYAVLPSRPKSFGEIYQSLMSSFPIDTLSSGTVQATSGQGSHSEIDPVLRAFLIGTDEQKRVATDWLVGRRVDMRSAPRILPLPYKLDSTANMQRVLVQLVGALSAGKRRLLLMLDEYQRARGYRPAVRDVLHTGILDCFNATPTGFSVVFSCSAVQQAAALDTFPPELTDRLRGRRLLCLPEMSEPEAVQFVTDLIRAFRPTNYNGDAFAPFAKDRIEQAMKAVAAASELRLIPRHVIQVLDLALGDAVSQNKDSVSSDELLRAVELTNKLTGED